MPSYESAVLGLNPNLGTQRAAHPAVHLSFCVGQQMGCISGETWKRSTVITLSQVDGLFPPQTEGPMLQIGTL